MTTKRERYIAIAAGAILGILAMDRVLLTPYLDRRARLSAEKKNLIEETRQARDLLSKQRELTAEWETMLKSGLKTGAAAAESETLNALRTWAEESGLTLASLKPGRSSQKGALREIMFQAVCEGPMSSVSRFLWRIESAMLPVKITDLQLAAKKEGADDLSLQVRVAALCIAPAEPPKKTSVRGASSTGEENR